MNALLLAFFLLFSPMSQARKRCVRVVGRVHCATDWDRHMNVVIHLVDKDPLPWEADDEMSRAQSDEDGNFDVEGCADDLGSWNDPDPYLLIEHRCPEPGYSVSIPRRRKIVPIERLFLPDVVYVESIRIDDDDTN